VKERLNKFGLMSNSICNSYKTKAFSLTVFTIKYLKTCFCYMKVQAFRLLNYWMIPDNIGIVEYFTQQFTDTKILHPKLIAKYNLQVDLFTT